MCSCVLRRHDLQMDDALLARSYAVLHAGVVHSSQVNDNRLWSLIKLYDFMSFKINIKSDKKIISYID